MGKIRKLYLYKIILQQVLTFMLRVKNNIISSALQEKFPLTQYNYSTEFSKNNYKKPQLNLRITQSTV